MDRASGVTHRIHMEHVTRQKTLKAEILSTAEEEQEEKMEKEEC